MKNWYDVSDFGAIGNGTTSDHGPITTAIAAAASHGGGVVWFPPGRYLIDKKVLVPNQMELRGAGWASRDPTRGSWIVSNAHNANVEIRGQGTTVNAIGFEQVQPNPTSSTWKPAPYDFAIHAATDDVFLKQINILNCTRGIRVGHFGGGAIGRVILDHIWGRPLEIGIQVDNALDVVKVNNTHFWPFWQESNNHVSKWVAANGTAFRILRADNPQFSNIFALGYSRGFHFSSSASGVTSKFVITNADCDYCAVGIEISGTNATGMVSNFNSQGAPGEIGIAINGPGTRLQANNIRLTSFRNNAIRASGSNVRVFLQNLWIELWNTSGAGFPGLEATDNAHIFLGRPAFFDRGNGAQDWRADGINGGKVFTDFGSLVSRQ